MGSLLTADVESKEVDLFKFSKGIDMSNKEIIAIANALAIEKNLDIKTVISAMESALAHATKKCFSGSEIDVRIEIDPNSGEQKAFRVWEVVEDSAQEFPGTQIAISDVGRFNPDLRVGDFYEERLDPVDFRRVSVQSAKQIILQKIREAEREQILSTYLGNHNGIVSGKVKRNDKGNLLIDCGKLEAFMHRDQVIPRENFRVGDKIRGYLQRVDRNSRFDQLVLSRTDNQFVIKLFENEIPEISDGLIEIVGCVREPGIRCKIAVKSNSNLVDPQGTCIGFRGSRINSISNELNGELVDVILYNEESANFVINALSPLSRASVRRILADEENRSMDVIVDEAHLAIAIGRGGHNVKLATALSGWSLHIMTIKQLEEEHSDFVSVLSGMSISRDVVMNLILEGFTSLEDIACISKDELLSISGLDETLADRLIERANEALSFIEGSAFSEIDIDALLVQRLMDVGIETLEGLAELSSGELSELLEISSKKAERIVSQAKECWFK